MHVVFIIPPEKFFPPRHGKPVFSHRNIRINYHRHTLSSHLPEILTFFLNGTRASSPTLSAMGRCCCTVCELLGDFGFQPVGIGHYATSSKSICVRSLHHIMVRKIGWADILREVADRHLQASDLYLGFDDESRPYLFQEQILGPAVRWCNQALQ